MVKGATDQVGLAHEDAAANDGDANCHDCDAMVVEGVVGCGLWVVGMVVWFGDGGAMELCFVAAPHLDSSNTDKMEKTAPHHCSSLRDMALLHLTGISISSSFLSINRDIDIIPATAATAVGANLGRQDDVAGIAVSRTRRRPMRLQLEPALLGGCRPPGSTRWKEAQAGVYSACRRDALQCRRGHYSDCDLDTRSAGSASPS